MRAPSLGLIPQRARNILAPMPAGAVIVYQAHEIAQDMHNIEPVRAASLGGMVIGLALYTLARHLESSYNQGFTPDRNGSVASPLSVIVAGVAGGLLGLLEGAVLHGNIAGSIVSGASSGLYSLRTATAIGLAPNLCAPQPETYEPTPDQWWDDKPNVFKRGPAV